MTVHAFFSTNLGSSARCARRSPESWSILPNLLAAAVLLLQVGGCTLHYGLTAPERAAVKAGDKAMVLVQIQCTIDDRPQDAFAVSNIGAGGRYFLFGLGSFDTPVPHDAVSEPAFVMPRFLTEEALRAGWTFFLLDPGIYYLAVVGPDSSYGEVVIAGPDLPLRKGPRWRIDVPEHVPCIYAGTLQFAGKTEGELMLGGKIIRPVQTDDVPLRNESANARQVIAEHFPDIGTPKTLLMQRWKPGEPIIIRTPRRSTIQSQ